MLIVGFPKQFFLPEAAINNQQVTISNQQSAINNQQSTINNQPHFLAR
jgi:hypothetical protein